MRPTSLNVFCEFGIWLPAITDDYSLEPAGQNLFENIHTATLSNRNKGFRGRGEYPDPMLSALNID